METIEILEAIPGNKRIYKELKQKILDKNVIAFTGSGISAQRFPTWKKLIEKLGRLAVEYNFTTKAIFNQWMDFAITKPDLVSSGIKEKLDPKFNEFFCEIFDNTGFKDKFDTLHDIIARINFKSIISTNYDICTEEALLHYQKLRRENIFIKDDERIGKFHQNLQKGTFSFHYIHGVQYQPSSIVFTSEDYDELYKNQDFQTHLKSITQQNSILFLGFGFNDFKIESLIRDKSYFNSTNYAFLSYKIPEEEFNKEEITRDLSEIRKMWLKQYNALVIFYPVIEREDDLDYTFFEKFLSLLDFDKNLGPRPSLGSEKLKKEIDHDETLDFIADLMVLNQFDFNIISYDTILVDQIGEIQVVTSKNNTSILRSFKEDRLYFYKWEFDPSAKRTKVLPSKFNIISMRDLFKSVMDFDNYLEWYVNNWKFDDTSKKYISLEIEPDGQNPKNYTTPIVADQFFIEGILNPKPVIFILKGEFGMGKTIITKKIMATLSKKYLEGKIDKIPIYINLNDLAKEPYFPSLLTFQLGEIHKIPNYSWEKFECMRDANAFMFICDGLDEMDVRLDETMIIQTLNNISELIEFSPTLLTSRPGLFHHKDQEELLVTELNSRKRDWFVIVDLDEELIFEYSEKSLLTREEVENFLEIVYNNNKLARLTIRPLFLEMLIQSYKDHNLGQISSIKELYSSYVDKYIKRETEKGRTIISKEQKLSIFKEMAWQWLETSEINWKDVRNITETQFEEEHRRKILEQYFAEIMVSSFIGRNSDGLYYQHKSFAEYFVSLSITEDGSPGIMKDYESKIPSISRKEIIEFIDDENVLYKLYKYENNPNNKIAIIDCIDDLEKIFRIGLEEKDNKVGFHIVSKLKNFPTEIFKEIIDEKIKSYPENSVEYVFKNQLLDLNEQNARVIIESKVLDRELKINAVELLDDEDYLYHLSLDHDDYQVRNSAIKKLPFKTVEAIFEKEEIPDDVFLYCIFNTKDIERIIHLAIHHKSVEIRHQCLKRLAELRSEIPQEYIMKMSQEVLLQLYESNKDHKYFDDLFELFDNDDLYVLVRKYSKKEKLGRNIIQRITDESTLNKISKLNPKFYKPVRNRIDELK